MAREEREWISSFTTEVFPGSPGCGLVGLCLGRKEGEGALAQALGRLPEIRMGNFKAAIPQTHHNLRQQVASLHHSPGLNPSPVRRLSPEP